MSTLDSPLAVESPRRRGRSVGAVLAGFVATAVLSVAVDAVLHATGVFPKPGAPMSTGLFVLASAYRALFAMVGGAVTAWLAPRRPMRHAQVLAGLGLLGGAAGVVVWWVGGPELGPAWYPVSLVVTAVPCVLGGAALALRRSGAPVAATA